MQISPLANKFTKPRLAAVGLALVVAGGGHRALAQKGALQIESQGARAFGGTTRPNPSDPTAYLSCDDGYVEWQIPPEPRHFPLVLTHGHSANARAYQTTFDGQPGFQTIFVSRRYPVYLVDFPRTGRAGLACDQYTYKPDLNSSRSNFNNRVGVWMPGTREPEYFPGVAFSRDPGALNQYLRAQYPDVSTPEEEQLESDALVVLLDEIYRERAKSILVSHSSGSIRSWLAAIRTDAIAGIIAFEPAVMMFPEGEVPPPVPQADGRMNTLGRTIPMDQFLKFTRFPILMVWGDNIPSEADPLNTGARSQLDRRRIGRMRSSAFAEAVNRHGGNAQMLSLPKAGVTGNTHYPFADTNVTRVADQVERWMKQQRLDTSCRAGKTRCP